MTYVNLNLKTISEHLSQLEFTSDTGEVLFRKSHQGTEILELTCWIYNEVEYFRSGKWNEFRVSEAVMDLLSLPDKLLRPMDHPNRKLTLEIQDGRLVIVGTQGAKLRLTTLLSEEILTRAAEIIDAVTNFRATHTKPTIQVSKEISDMITLPEELLNPKVKNSGAKTTP